MLEMTAARIGVVRVKRGDRARAMARELARTAREWARDARRSWLLGDDQGARASLELAMMDRRLASDWRAIWRRAA